MSVLIDYLSVFLLLSIVCLQWCARPQNPVVRSIREAMGAEVVAMVLPKVPHPHLSQLFGSRSKSSLVPPPPPDSDGWQAF